jgi:hypothetical protein
MEKMANLFDLCRRVWGSGVWGNGEMGKWGNGEMGKWGNGEVEHLAEISLNP